MFERALQERSLEKTGPESTYVDCLGKVWISQSGPGAAGRQTIDRLSYKKVGLKISTPLAAGPTSDHVIVVVFENISLIGDK